MKKKYKILMESDSKPLEEKVNRLAEAGWDLLNVAASTSSFPRNRLLVATMVKDRPSAS